MSSASSNLPRPPPIGSLIDDGALELVSVLGYGGYGVVYRAVDTRSTAANPPTYAVKCLLHAQSRNAVRQRRLHIQEITLHQLASVHPHVVTLHRVIEEEGCTFIVMDYCPDGDLFGQILHKRRYLGHDGLIKHVFLQLLDAVEFCHSLGIYHRDLKPENVLCFNGGLRLMLTDFGLATTDKVSEEFRTGSVYHMSPECQGGVFAPSGTYSPPFNDIWSLGIILLNLITGRNPWKSAAASDPTFQAYLQDPTNFLPSVLPISSEVNEILLMTLDVNWRSRITLAELRHAIKGVTSFYSDDVVFEGSMARCSWEAGIDITGESSPEEEPLDLPEQEEPKSAWSNDSGTDMVFADQPEEEEASWTRYTASGATWGGDSGLRSRSPSTISTSFLTFDNRRTPSSSFSMYSPALSDPYESTRAEDEFTDSTFVDGSDRFPPQVMTVDAVGQAYESSIIMQSADSATMHTALESPDTYDPSIFLQSSVSVSKPSFAESSTYEVAISGMGDDEEPFRDSMSWTQASYDQPSHSDVLDMSAMELSITTDQTDQEHTAVGHGDRSRRDRDLFSPPNSAPPQGAMLPFPLVPLLSSPATTTPFHSTASSLRERPKPRSSSFFNPIKFAFPPRSHTTPPPAVKGRTTPVHGSYPPHPSPRIRPSEDLKNAMREGENPSLQPQGEHNRRHRRQPLRSARNWLFSGRLFAAGAV